MSKMKYCSIPNPLSDLRSGTRRFDVTGMKIIEDSPRLSDFLKDLTLRKIGVVMFCKNSFRGVDKTTSTIFNNSKEDLRF